MAFVEDIDEFFDEFGVAASFGAETVNVLYDSPESIIAGGDVISADYAISYKTGHFRDMGYGDIIKVEIAPGCKESFTVNSVMTIEDGKLTRATLSK